MRYPRQEVVEENDIPDKENLNPLLESYSPKNKKKISRRQNVLKDITERYKVGNISDENIELSAQQNSEIEDIFQKITDSPIKKKNLREL